MDPELDDLQLELQRVARDLVVKECPPSLVRAVVEGHADGTDLWSTIVGLEWPGLTVPVEHGGSGASAIELVILLEELGHGADPTPFFATAGQYVPLVREAFGDAGGALLEAVCAGTSGAVVDAPGRILAEADGDRWRLTGTARTVIDGDRADELAVVARTGDDAASVGVFVIPGSSVSATRTPSFDNALHVADVTFDGVVVGPDRAATGPDIAAGVERARQEAVTALAAVIVGASQRCFDLALEHLKSRKQFGVPIGSFQALKHMAVDVYVALQRARALTYFSAMTIAEDDPRRSVAASMAKAAAGDAQRIAVRHSIQFFGGLGFTWENDLHLYARRAKAGGLLLGTSTEHRARVARETLAELDPEGAVR
jgi:alkylation response protein AidB-like acyl-CoA dehydrogenase